MKKKWDVVIVGSGISALTSAILLLRSGKSVLILEKYRKPGGYLHCFSRYTCLFDTGAHYLGALDNTQPFNTLLRYLNSYNPDDFVRLDPEGFDVMKFPGFEVQFCEGVTRNIESLSKVFPSETDGIKKYFDLVMQVARTFPTFEFNPKYDQSFVTKYLEMPLTEVVESCTKNPDLQCVLYSYCVLHGVQPQDVGFAFHALVTASLISSAWGLKNGGDALTRSLLNEVESLGGEIRLDNGVKKIVLDDSKLKWAKGVETESGNFIEADQIISSTHPKQTLRWLDAKAIRPAFRSRVEGAMESTGIFGIYAACKSEPPLSRLKNYYAFGSSDPAKFKNSRNEADRPWVAYLSRTERIDKKRKYHPLTIHVPMGFKKVEKWAGHPPMRRPEEYNILKQNYMDEALEFVKSMYPKTVKSIEKAECSTPASNLFYNGSEEGSGYGVYHDIAHTGIRAIGPRTPIRNLLLTGQNTLFPGIYAAAISGLRSAGHLVGTKKMISDLKQTKEMQV